MAIAFRALSTAVGFTGSEPTGTAQGDFLIALATTLGPSAPTGPAGWVQRGTTRSITGPYYGNIWTITRGASAPSYTWGGGGSTDRLLIAAYSGGGDYLTSGDSADGSAVSPSVNATAANQMLLSLFYDFAGGFETAPTGMTSRNAALRCLADLVTSGSGATGTKTWTNTAGPVGAWAVLLAVLDFAVSGVSVGYGSYTRTSPNNTPWTCNFTAGVDATNYEVRTAASGGGTLVASGAATSGANGKTIAYNATGLADGSQTLYVRVGNGTSWGADASFTLLRDDVAPTASTSISTTPGSVPLGATYTVTATPNDAASTGVNEMAYEIRTAASGGGTFLTSGSCTSGSAFTTGIITDSGLTVGSNTRYVRTRDGANNWTDTSFTVNVVAGAPKPMVVSQAVQRSAVR